MLEQVPPLRMKNKLRWTLRLLNGKGISAGVGMAQNTRNPARSSSYGKYGSRDDHFRRDDGVI